MKKIFISLICLCASSVNAEINWQETKPSFEVITQAEQIKLKDGVILDALVSYPAKDKALAEGKFPVLIEFSPYSGTAEKPLQPHSYFVERGYISALVRPRGTGKSTGEIQQFGNQDGLDSQEVIAWAKKLKNSSGEIGMYGCSYPGALALKTAAFAQKGEVKAVFASCIGLNMQHRQVWTSNGLPNAVLTSYALQAGGLISPSGDRYFKQFMNNVLAAKTEAYENEYWQERLPLSDAEKIVKNEIPVFIQAGWLDINEVGALHAYMALQNAYAGRDIFANQDIEKSTPRYQVLIGDWQHAQALNLVLAQKWFDTWIKGEKTGLETAQKTMHLFEKGSNRWVNVEGWAIVKKYTPLYLTADNQLLSSKAKEDSSKKINFTRPEKANGKLTFTTQPFKDGATLSGSMSLKLYAKSNNTNLALIAKLYDLSPNGEKVLINRGAILGSQREIDEAKSKPDENGVFTWAWQKLNKDDLLEPNKIYELHLALSPRQWGILPNHSLELELTSQSSADICPDEGMPPFLSEPCRLTELQQQTLPKGEYEILIGENSASALNLPLLPFNYFKEVKSGELPQTFGDFERLNNAPNDGIKHTFPLDFD